VKIQHLNFDVHDVRYGCKATAGRELIGWELADKIKLPFNLIFKGNVMNKIIAALIAGFFAFSVTAYADDAAPAAGDKMEKHMDKMEKHMDKMEEHQDKMAEHKDGMMEQKKKHHKKMKEMKEDAGK
jgi:hypothetical protein